MNTKQSITPWYQPQLKPFKINYIQNPIRFYNEIKQDKKIQIRKKQQSFNTLQKKSKSERIKDLDQFTTAKSLQKIDQQSTLNNQKQGSDLQKIKSKIKKKFFVYKQRKARSSKKIRFDEFDQFSIFIPKCQLSSQRSYIKLPKVNIKPLK